MLYLAHGILFIAVIVVTVLVGYVAIPALQQVFPSGKREYTPTSHEDKSRTPSAGGILFVSVLIICGALCASVAKDITHVVLTAVLLSFAAIGMYDDLQRLWYQRGVSERGKFLLQVVCAALFASCWYATLSSMMHWFTPIGVFSIPVGIWYIPWVIFVVVGTSNAVNLTDGLDGLAATSVFWHASALAVVYGVFLGIEYDISPLYITWCVVLAGAMLGFLWHNAYPAQVFMGDVGSLSLGALCAAMAITTGTEWLLPFTLIVPVIETFSVIIQVFCKKMWNIRLFCITPIHHHFEMIGWHEATIVARASVIGVVAVTIALIGVYYTC